MLTSYSVARYRFSSVQLLGDLLFHISGVTGKMTTETASEDDNFGTAASNKVCLSALIEHVMSGMRSQFIIEIFLGKTKKSHIKVTQYYNMTFAIMNITFTFLFD